MKFAYDGTVLVLFPTIAIDLQEPELAIIWLFWGIMFGGENE